MRYGRCLFAYADVAAVCVCVPVKVCRLWELFALRVHDSIVVAFYTVIGFMCLFRAMWREHVANVFLLRHCCRGGCLRGR